jgi:hypothetical protein
MRHIGRLGRLLATSLLAVFLLVAACGESPGPNDNAGTTGSISPTKQVPVLPAGWRWESYAGVEVGVPADWGWGNGGQRINQWCAAMPDDKLEPIVGRPGPQTLVGCHMGKRGPNPETLLKNTGVVVSFNTLPEGEAGPARREDGDRLMVTLNGVVVEIHADQALRAQIAATIHAVDLDSYGCPATDPVSAHPGARPEAVDVTTLTEVSAVSACKYALAQDYQHTPPALISSLRLEGQIAQDAIAAVAHSPAGGGPDAPDTCITEVSYGDELVVLRVTSAQGESKIYLRYSGCDHNGFDDGVTVRALTAAAVRPFVADANQVQSASGPTSKYRMLRPDHG